LNGEDEPLFGDIEIDDFNKLFRNPNLISDRFGESVSVKLLTDGAGNVTREVKEDLTKAKIGVNGAFDMELEDPNEMSMYS